MNARAAGQHRKPSLRARLIEWFNREPYRLDAELAHRGIEAQAQAPTPAPGATIEDRRGRMEAHA